MLLLCPRLLLQIRSKEGLKRDTTSEVERWNTSIVLPQTISPSLFFCSVSNRKMWGKKSSAEAKIETPFPDFQELHENSMLKRETGCKKAVLYGKEKSGKNFFCHNVPYCTYAHRGSGQTSEFFFLSFSFFLKSRIWTDRQTQPFCSLLLS